MAGLGRGMAALAARSGAFGRALGDRLAAWRAGMTASPARLAAAAPEPLEIGDAEAAARLAAGEVRFAGETALLGPRGPWAAAAPSPAWAEAMHGFLWLDDAAAAARADRARLAAWAVDWARRYGRGAGPGWRPALAGRRLARLACAAPDLLPSLDPVGRRRMLRLLTAHLRFLAARMGSTPDPVERLEAAAGLALGALAATGEAKALGAAKAMLGAAGALVAQDGGAAGARDADRLARAFCALAWSHAALAQAGSPPDPRHAAALASLGPALRALRLGDGGFARFHGAGAAAPAPLDAAFAVAGAAGRGSRREAAAGFERLAAGRLRLVLDAAPPPQGARAGGSTLGFELSAGRALMIGSVGPGAGFGPEWEEASRATGAFSAVEVGASSCVRLAPDDAAGRALGRTLARAPKRVRCERAEDAEALWLLAEHDGYLDRFGLTVARRLRLSRDGADLRGEDTVAAPTPEARARLERAAREGGLEITARFHLPPGVSVEAISDGLLLTPPDGPGWLFRASGGRVSVAEGVWLDPPAGRVRRSRQIVATTLAADGGARIVWGLSRIASPPRPRPPVAMDAAAAP
jgi:uncharacterized heparinase superfamily protein